MRPSRPASRLFAMASQLKSRLLAESHLTTFPEWLGNDLWRSTSKPNGEPKRGNRHSILADVLQLVAFALYNLCKLPEYLEPLREEIKATEHLGSKKWDHMHLMDSFLKETARLQPSLACEHPLSLLIYRRNY